MEQQRIWLIAGIASAAILLVCAATGTIGYLLLRDTFAALGSHAGTASVDGNIAAQPEAGTGVLLQDDFSDPGSGWERAGYIDGKYRLTVDGANYTVWDINRSFDLVRLDDVRIEVDVAQIEGLIDSSFGVACRIDDDRMYSFEISTDGWYAITKMIGEDITVLVEAEEFSEAIQPGEATYRIRGDCIGDRLALYINGEKVAEAQDDELQYGSAGLQISSYDAPKAVAEFDNVVVSKP